MKNSFNFEIITLLFVAIMVLGISNIYSQNNPNIYGYFSARLEKVLNVPGFEDGEIEEETEDFEWQYPYINLMFQYDVNDRINTFLNISYAGETALNSFEVKNIWAEYSFDNAFKLRLGKSYRKFGLFNEILDAVPTYFGIEPPQYLNNDHKIISLLPRTTVAMAYGTFNLGGNSLNYALSIDKGMSEVYESAFPISLDLNYKLHMKGGNLLIGGSYYTSGGSIELTGEEEEAEEEEGDIGYIGSLPWMSEDEFSVLGGYLQLELSDFTIQAGYWQSGHSAERNPELLEEFLLGNENEDHVNYFLNDDQIGIDEGNIIADTEYDISTWYVRLAYSFYTDIGEIAPYVHLDHYKNPEIQALPRLDEEHNGTPDDGEFQILTIGLLFRPEPVYAVKLDMGLHQYDFYGESVSYPEFKLDFSFIFGQ